MNHIQDYGNYLVPCTTHTSSKNIILLASAQYIYVYVSLTPIVSIHVYVYRGDAEFNETVFSINEFNDILRCICYMVELISERYVPMWCFFRTFTNYPCV